MRTAIIGIGVTAAAACSLAIAAIDGLDREHTISRRTSAALAWIRPAGTLGAQIAAQGAALARHDAKFAAVFATMREAAEAAGVPAANAQEPFRRLRVVGKNEGPAAVAAGG